VKRVRTTLLGPGSSSGVNKPEAGLIELSETTVRRDIDINLLESLVNSINNTEPNAIVKAKLKFSSKALILGRRVGSFYQRELKEGSRSRVEELKEELKGQADKHAEEKTAWKKEREEWMGEKKRLGSWRVRCLDSEKNLNAKIVDIETDFDELKEKHDGLESKLEDLKGQIIQEHINGFQKGLRQVAFFHKDIDVSDAMFDVNKDVVGGQLVNEADSSLEEKAEKVAEEAVVNTEEVAAEGGNLNNI